MLELTQMGPQQLLKSLNSALQVNAVISTRRVKKADHQGYHHSPYDWWLFKAFTTSPKTCDLCKALDLTEWRGDWIPDKFPYHRHVRINMIKASVHPNCFIKGTLVHTSKGLIPIENVQLGDWVLTHRGRFRPVIERHKNKFHGCLYRINGEWMTPNHPILTLKGWMAANSLNSVSDRVFYLDSPNAKSNKAPSLFREKLFLSLIKTLMMFGSVPMSAVNFNGELHRRNSKVNIENVDSVLRNNLDSSFLKCFKEKLFKRRHSRIRLATPSPLKQIFPRFDFSPNSVMSSLHLMLSLLRRHLTPLQPFSFTSPSGLNPSFNESSSDYSSVDTITLSQSILRNAFNSVEVNDSVNRKNMIPHYNTSTITHIDKQRYKGYVYNLSVYEDESYTIGNRGLVVHNCRCRLIWVGRSLYIYNVPLGFGELWQPTMKELERLGPSQLQTILELLERPWILG